MEVAELLEMAIANVGESALADEFGYTLSTAARTFAAWRSGPRTPSYRHTLTLLDAAGLLLRPEDVLKLQGLGVDMEQIRARRRRRQDP